MSNTRYLEIDSTYRNRMQYPNPSNFTVMISQTGTRGAVDAYDPVCNSAPLITWSPSQITDCPTGTILKNYSNTKNRFIVFFTKDAVKKKPDYYRGLPIEVDKTASDDETDVRIITEWQYINTVDDKDYFWVNISQDLSDIPVSEDDDMYMCTFKPSTDINKGLFYVPDSPVADNFYAGCYNLNNGRY